LPTGHTTSSFVDFLRGDGELDISGLDRLGVPLEAIRELSLSSIVSMSAKELSGGSKKALHHQRRNDIASGPAAANRSVSYPQ
jgi:hypothetical protein